MRRGMQGLALQVQEGLSRDPHGGDLFIFRGRRGDLAKILWHDGVGLSLYAKRLDRGKFIWPSASDGAIAISPAQMAYMLEGIDWVRRETGKRQEVKVHHGEGVAIHTDPESCANGREAAREALTGARAGQPLSGERLRNRSADVIQSAEGNTDGCVNASTRSAPRHRRPWHARKSLVREPRDLHTATGCRSRGRIGKARCRSR
jgi:transposase